MPAVDKSTRQTVSVGRYEILVIFWIICRRHLWICLSIGLRVPLTILHLLLLLPYQKFGMIRYRIFSAELSILMDSLGFFQFLCRELNGVLLVERLR